MNLLWYYFRSIGTLIFVHATQNLDLLNELVHLLLLLLAKLFGLLSLGF